MNFFGYSKSTNDELLELIEMTVQASPEKLRKLASFLNQCADDIESDEGWEHEHFSDYTSDFDESSPDLIVFKEQ